MSVVNLSDMIEIFGEVELLRLTSPDGSMPDALLPATPEAARIERALEDGRTLAESYLAKRYGLPIASPSRPLARCICALARFDLAHGENREPTEQMRLERKAWIEWLSDIASGKIDLPEAAAKDIVEAAFVSDREKMFGAEELKQW